MTINELLLSMKSELNDFQGVDFIFLLITLLTKLNKFKIIIIVEY